MPVDPSEAAGAAEGATVVAESDDLRVLAGYPGANVDDPTIDGDVVRVDREFRDTGSEWTFWWSFALESDRGREVTVRFPEGLVGRFGPAVSADRREWRWLGADATPDRRRFRYEFAPGERVFVTMSFPYTLADFERLWDDVGDDPAAERERLATSELGREVPVVRLGDPEAAEHTLLAARHHACEAPGSWALDGTIRELLDDGALAGRCVHVVPFVDVDGVQRGDQGKERLPHDHNRDYGDGNALLDDIDPIYRATAAIQRYVRDLDGDLALALDYHAPFKWGSDQWGDLHDRVFFAGAPDDATAGERRLADYLDAETGREDALDFDADDGFGEPGGFSGGTSFAGFCERQGASLATTLEVPYVGHADDRTTPGRYRGLGRAVGRAAVDWLCEVSTSSSRR